MIFISIITFIISLVIGYLLILFFKKKSVVQYTSKHLVRHSNKEGTPTMGGFIFVIPTMIFLVLLLIFNKSIYLYLFLISLIGYMLLGFYDDFTKIKYHNNSGLSINKKFLCELVIAIIFYMVYLIIGFDNTIIIFNHEIDISFLYGILILGILVGTTNAVNITDGLDGLCSGLMIISLLFFDIYLLYPERSLNFILICSLLGFLVYNFYPAKIFMGDLGSLFLGAYLGTLAIITKKELLLIGFALVYIIEILSSFIQVIAIKKFNKKIFLKAPLHHHFEEKGFSEKQIVFIFYGFNILINIIMLILIKIHIL